MAARVPAGRALLLTTQPGWAFASVAELRRGGWDDYAAFHHRDSTAVLPAQPALLEQPLCTPAEVCGLLHAAEGGRDATAGFARSLDPAAFKQRLLEWLPLLEQTGRRRFSVAVESWGETALHRHALADLIRTHVQRQFPRWNEVSAGGARLLCKADPRAAVLGVQLYANLGREENRPGTLRQHLACALLTLAGVQAGDALVDPFMGTGTILEAGRRRFGAAAFAGAEVDAGAFAQAKAHRLDGATLVRGSFEALDPSVLPAGPVESRRVRLVSNLPFGVQFEPVPTARLLAFVARWQPALAGMALLLGRDQAAAVAAACGLRAKNVLVLGVPAAIVAGAPRFRHRAPAPEAA